MKVGLRKLALSALFFISFEHPAHAREINLAPQNVSICVGKTGVVMNTKTQLDELVVNRVTSRQSTFQYRGTHANYTCDFDAGDSIIGRCNSVGSQTLEVILAFKYNDPNTYRVAINVDCRFCPMPRPVPVTPRPPVTPKPGRGGVIGRE